MSGKLIIKSGQQGKVAELLKNSIICNTVTIYVTLLIFSNRFLNFKMIIFGKQSVTSAFTHDLFQLPPVPGLLMKSKTWLKKKILLYCAAVLLNVHIGMGCTLIREISQVIDK